MKTKKFIITSLLMFFGIAIYAQNKMFKNYGCICCDLWAKHMKENGFNFEITDTKKMNQLKDKIRIPLKARGCHTAIIDGLIVEGHVPADLVLRLLKDRPEGIIGISVPGMPAGSPGMERNYKEEYTVVVFDSKGKIKLYDIR